MRAWIEHDDSLYPQIEIVSDKDGVIIPLSRPLPWSIELDGMSPELFVVE